MARQPTLTIRLDAKERELLERALIEEQRAKFGYPKLLPLGTWIREHMLERARSVLASSILPDTRVGR